MQSTPPCWEFENQQQHHVNGLNDDICELNQENVNLFNTQQYSQQPYPFNENINSNLYNNSFTYNDSDLYLSNNTQQPPLHSQMSMSHTSSESSPGFKVEPHQTIMSPEPSESSGIHVDEVVGKVKNKKTGVKSKKQLLDEQDAILIARDDSELNEEELQLKRKAQNRAAQRAFRERKETKLKELEAKLLKSEEQRQTLLDELDVIKKQNLSIVSENEVLRNDPNYSAYSLRNQHQIDKFHFPKSQDEFINGIVKGTNHVLQDDNKNKIYVDQEGNKVLAIGAVWDYLQIKAEEANLDFGAIDINELMNKLRGQEKCHGWGPAYEKKTVDLAIQSCLSN